jgi:hypothetical protein
MGTGCGPYREMKVSPSEMESDGTVREHSGPPVAGTNPELKVDRVTY